MGAEATLKFLLLGEDRSASKVFKKTGDEAEGAKSKFHGYAKAAGVAVAGGLLAAGAAAIKFARGAAEDEAAASKLAHTMQRAAGATKAQVAQTEDWITAQGKAFGVADDDLRPALSKLVVATHDVGKAQRLASLAMDVSAGTGKDLGAVSAALAKAQNGNVAGLARLGIATKDADGKTKSLKQITDDLAKTYGGSAAKAAETTEGKQKRLTVALNEAGESIGYKLLPFMLKLTNAATEALGWMQAHERLVKILAIGIGSLAAAVIAINTAVRIWTAVQSALNVVLAANPIGLVVLAIAALVIGIVVAYKRSETFRTIVNGAFSAIAAGARAMWDVIRPVLKAWFNVWATVVGGILEGAAKAFGWVPGLGGKLKAASKEFNKFRDNVNNALDGIHDKKVTVTANVVMQRGPGGMPVFAGDGGNPHNAVGTRFFSGGVSWVGERGPELAFMPRGTAVATADQSARMFGVGSDDLGTLTVVVQTETGEVIEKKLAKVKRNRGGARLAFEVATA